jgi:hypothetical protein
MTKKMHGLRCGSAIHSIGFFRKKKNWKTLELQRWNTRLTHLHTKPSTAQCESSQVPNCKTDKLLNHHTGLAVTQSHCHYLRHTAALAKLPPCHNTTLTNRSSVKSTHVANLLAIYNIAESPNCHTATQVTPPPCRTLYSAGIRATAIAATLPLFSQLPTANCRLPAANCHAPFGPIPRVPNTREPPSPWSTIGAFSSVKSSENSRFSPGKRPFSSGKGSDSCIF